MIRPFLIVSTVGAVLLSYVGAVIFSYQLGKISTRDAVFVEKFDRHRSGGYQYFGACVYDGDYAYCPEFDHDSHAGLR